MPVIQIYDVVAGVVDVGTGLVVASEELEVAGKLGLLACPITYVVLVESPC